VESEILYEVNSLINLLHIKKLPQLKLEAKHGQGTITNDSDLKVKFSINLKERKEVLKNR
jgi:hypothetical protein